MSLYLGKQKVQVPKVTIARQSKLPKAFFDAGGKFEGMTMTSVDGWFSYSDTADVTDMYQMFYSCRSLTSVPFFDTSKVTSMYYMFRYCSKLTEVSAFNTSKVTNMHGMFSDCSALTEVPLFDTSNVTDMGEMFQKCPQLTSVPAFDTSKVTNMYSMFNNCSSLTEIPAFDTSKITSNYYMTGVFNGCRSLTAIHMTGMKVSFDISASTKFTESALVEILNNLATVTSTKTLTMGSTNLAKLTDDEKAIATDKGWTLK